jgi:hypothetical protein
MLRSVLSRTDRVNSFSSALGTPWVFCPPAPSHLSPLRFAVRPRASCDHHIEQRFWPRSVRGPCGHPDWSRALAGSHSSNKDGIRACDLPFLLLTAFLGPTLPRSAFWARLLTLDIRIAPSLAFSCPHSAPLTVLAELGYLERLQGRACVA